MNARLLSVFRWALFSLLVSAGIVGLLLPVIPQVPFFIAAFVVIAPESRWVRKKYIEFRERHPRLFAPIDRWRDRRRRTRQEAQGHHAPDTPTVDPDLERDKPIAPRPAPRRRGQGRRPDLLPRRDL